MYNNDLRLVEFFSFLAHCVQCSLDHIYDQGALEDMRVCSLENFCSNFSKQTLYFEHALQQITYLKEQSFYCTVLYFNGKDIFR